MYIFIILCIFSYYTNYIPTLPQQDFYRYNGISFSILTAFWRHITPFHSILILTSPNRYNTRIFQYQSPPDFHNNTRIFQYTIIIPTPILHYHNPLNRDRYINTHISIHTGIIYTRIFILLLFFSEKAKFI